MQKRKDTTSLIKQIVEALAEVAPVECIWKRGLTHQGGPHYRIRGMFSPITIGEDELDIFGRLIEILRPENSFIIGNAFGVSSVYIAKMMEHFDGREVITLDNKSEGNGELCFYIAAQLSEKMGARILINKVGQSPQDVAKAAVDESYDLIFIDGLHSHPQVTQDFNAINNLTRRESVICWHDYWLPGIQESVKTAEKDGYLCLKVNSSCELVYGTRSPEVYRKIEQLFPNGEKPGKRRMGLTIFYRLSKVFLSFIFHKYIMRQRLEAF